MLTNKEQHKQPTDKTEPAAQESSVAAQRGEVTNGSENTSGIQMPDTPKIELPKGGGAIRSMGEKFQANPVTGTGSFSVPIAMTEGRGGFTPALGLSYNSGSGNSPYGMGWNIGLPSISRKTQQELPQYKDSEESDTFLLSGAEDLIPALRKTQTGDWIRDEFTTTLNGYPYHVYRYRPRIEGLFARIERWVNRSDHKTHWRSITRDNITTWYGQTDESRIADPTDPTRIFQWLIDETRDDKGNVIQYVYQQEDAYGVENTLPEKNRLAAGKYAQRYLKHVYYGNTVMHTDPDFAATNEWLFQLAFDYGDLGTNSPTTATNPEWDAREDAFSTYRAGFEVRTQRICQRILMFHNFTELGGTTLVKATEFEYDDDLTGYRLITAQHHGYKDGNMDSLPPMRFSYTTATLDDTLRHFDVDDLENLPMGVDGQQYQWTDLYGEGITGVLTENDNAWYYKRNEGDEAYYQDHPATSPPPPDIRFGAQHTVAAKPNMGGMQQLGDFNGDGQPELLIRSESLNGYFTLDTSMVDSDSKHPELVEGWSRFKHLENVPVLNWEDPNLRLIDLNGDGVPDVLLSDEHCFRYWPSELDSGYGERLDISTYTDEEQGPKLVFADAEQVIHLADMSGDGLTDLVRVRNGEVCYWPNMGYGRFGQKVTMDGAPTLDHPDHFSRARVRLADMDGSGTTDLIYLGTDTVYYWNNQSGNRFSLVKEIKHFPKVDSLAAVNVMDLFGKGTSCLVWSSPLPGDEPYRIRYIDLFGQKPYLLSEVDNSVGGLHRYHYTTSTKFYLRDRQEGKPWITKLPFPVQVVERTEQYDQITGARFVSRYAYHHGYFDHHEREFRGFGMVEQWDTEQYENFQQGDLFQVGTNALDEDSHIPPIKTKSWFHLGFWEDASTITQQYATEYYQGDAQAMELPDSILSDIDGAEETRQAMRALKGQLLRSEVYAEDNTPEAAHPYTVTTANFKVKRVQPGYQTIQPSGRWNHQLASFLVIPQENLSHHYERNPSDPRVSHSLVLDTDDYGLVKLAANVAYPRRGTGHPQAESTGLVTITENAYIHLDSIINIDNYRIGLPYQSYTHELTGVSFSSTPLTILSLDNDWQAASPIDYSDTPTHSSLQKRVFQGQLLAYKNNDDSSVLPIGQAETLGLVYAQYQLALTASQRDAVYNNDGTNRVSQAMITADASYVVMGNNYWHMTGYIDYNQNNFYSIRNTQTSTGGRTWYFYDSYQIATIRVKQDPYDLETHAVIDYRTMSPSEVKDINGNRQQVSFDALGMVTAVAVMGKSSESLGDTLAAPTQKVSYKLDEWMLHSKPNWIKTEVRTTHQDPDSDWLVSYEYTGGLGQVILQKALVEPGDAFERDSMTDELVLNAQGKPQLAPANPRWVGNGRTIFNNKGKAVKQYEPYFSSIAHYEDEDEVRTYGVSPVVHYDPLGRVIRTDMPDGTFTKVEFDCWQQKNYDQNDTVIDSDWYDRIIVNPLPAPDNPSAAEIRSANLAAKHYNTPQVVHLDVLGRVYQTFDNNGTHNTGTGVTSDILYHVTVELDIESKRRKVTNELGQETVFAYSMLPLDEDGNGQVLYMDSPDGGWRRMLYHAPGMLFRAWDERGHLFRNEYDRMDRPIEAWVNEGSGEQLVGYTVYGDDGRMTTPEIKNLRGQAIRIYDQSGAALLESVDFKGNVLEADKKLAKDYEHIINWATLTSQTNLSDLDTEANNFLENETFTISTIFDALNRPTLITQPDGSQHKPGYNEASLLEKMEVKLAHESSFTEMVTNINYDAKGQREKIVYGNGAFTEYTYDPNTFRLKRLLTNRPDTPDDIDTDLDKLQDLNYTFDAVGNIVELEDKAQDRHFFNNTDIQPKGLYEYDALYRLVKAEGREKDVLGEPDHNGLDFELFTSPKPTAAFRKYRETYAYDELGNIISVKHDDAGSGGGNVWKRNYHYDNVGGPVDSLTGGTLSGVGGNRLLSTYAGTVPPTSPDFSYDVHGNMLTMPHLTGMTWDFADQLKSTSKTVIVNGGTDYGQTTHYVYSGGERVRKVVINNLTDQKQYERIYLGGYEIYREYSSGTPQTITQEKQTNKVMDDQRMIAMLEYKSKGTNVGSLTTRYQFTNHLDSAALELDENAKVISYEEYHPFGTTAYSMHSNATEVSMKRYRYVHKELDTESGLYYYGARYYAAWLCRFVSVDPLKDKFPYYTTYQYAGNRPINAIDLDGAEAKEKIDSTEKGQQQGTKVKAGEPGQKSIKTNGNTNWYYQNDESGEPQGMGGESKLRAVEISAEDTRPWWKKAAHWVRDNKEGILDGLQVTLDIVGFIPIIGDAVDIVNAGISLLRGDYIGAALGLAAAIPVAGILVGAAKAGRTGYKAYKRGKAAKKAAENLRSQVDEVAGSEFLDDFARMGDDVVEESLEKGVKTVEKSGEVLESISFGKNFDKKVRKHIDQVRKRFDGQIDEIPSPGKGGNDRVKEIIQDRVSQGGGYKSTYSDEAVIMFEDGGVVYVFRQNGEFWTILKNKNK